DAVRAGFHIRGAAGFIDDERILAGPRAFAEVWNVVINDRRHRVRPSMRWVHVDLPDQLRMREVGYVERRRLTRVAISDVEPLVLLVDDRVVRILTFIARLAVL